MSYPHERIEKLNAEFDLIIDDCCKRAGPVIEANAELIAKLIPVLVEKRSMFKPECEKVLKDLGGIKNKGADS